MNKQESSICSPQILGNENWFFEATIPNCEAQFKIGIKIKEKLFSKQSPFQQVDIYNTVTFGKMLVLDGIVQTTEADNFIYHEMMTHIPMFSHPNPQNVLIIGAGDGGILREVLQHPVKSAVMIEIDEMVVEACKKHMPKLSNGAFENPKATILFKDGKTYIKNHKNAFDVIILDLCDPVGPAEDLITEEFYTDVKNALTKDGVISIQSGSLAWQPKEVTLISQRVKKIFKSVEVHKGVIPTYQGGEFSFTIASKQNLTKISLDELTNCYNKLGLTTRYYSPQIHKASAVLPKYLEQTINVSSQGEKEE